ncbi:MAG TPA: hypothetical protein VNI01_14255 [Elusimicrobiota bacterium]|jgi:hypothetical protein|nr:hypothetical protein [Elusimicrobiota bacterium]
MRNTALPLLLIALAAPRVGAASNAISSGSRGGVRTAFPAQFGADAGAIAAPSLGLSPGASLEIGVQAPALPALPESPAASAAAAELARPAQALAVTAAPEASRAPAPVASSPAPALRSSVQGSASGRPALKAAGDDVAAMRESVPALSAFAAKADLGGAAEEAGRLFDHAARRADLAAVPLGASLAGASRPALAPVLSALARPERASPAAPRAAAAGAALFGLAPLFAVGPGVVAAAWLGGALGGLGLVLVVLNARRLRLTLKDLKERAADSGAGAFIGVLLGIVIGMLGGMAVDSNVPGFHDFSDYLLPGIGLGAAGGAALGWVSGYYKHVGAVVLGAVLGSFLGGAVGTLGAVLFDVARILLTNADSSIELLGYIALGSAALGALAGAVLGPVAYLKKWDLGPAGGSSGSSSDLLDPANPMGLTNPMSPLNPIGFTNPASPLNPSNPSSPFHMP